MGVGDAAALADGAEDVDLVLVSADLARCGLGGVVGAVAVLGTGFGLGLRVVGVAGFGLGLRVVGVAGFGLRVVGVDGVAHGLAVDGDGVVGVAAGGVEALQGAVELVGADAHQDVADDELAGHLVAAVPVPAPEPLAGARGQVLGPLGHGLVAARAAQRGAGGDGEHRRQRVAPALAAAGVVDVGEAVGQRTHGVGGDHGFRASVAVGGVERGAGQARPRVGNEGSDEDQLGRGRDGAVAAAHAAEAARAPDAGPVRGAVHRAAEACRVDEGLQQQQRMAEARVGQSAARRHPHSASTREPRFGTRRPGRIRKRLLLASRCWRSYWVRKSQPIQRSRAPHFSAGAEKPASATHSPRQRAAYHSVSPIFGSAPR